MVKIKICGLRRCEDIDVINAYPIDYAGFVFAPSSREITPQQARPLIKNLKSAKAVGIFVNAPIHQILEIAEYCGLDILQLHGDEDETFISSLKQQTSCTIWKALRLKTSKDLEKIENLSPDRFLIDSFSESSYGGSGKQIAPTLLQNVNLENIMLAGGIHCDNLLEILELHPYGVDVSSGVEVDGFKNKQKIQEFMKKFEEVNL